MSCGDYQNLNTGYAFNSNWSSSNTNYGPFYLNNNSPSNTNAALGFALRKYVLQANRDHETSLSRLSGFLYLGPVSIPKRTVILPCRGEKKKDGQRQVSKMQKAAVRVPVETMPKTYGNLGDEIFSLPSLYKAFHAAVKGSRDNDDVIEARNHAEAVIDKIYRAIQDGTWEPGAYRQFITKKEVKRRLIDEPPFPDRVVHHAIKDNVEKFFEDKFIFDSYAVTPGKGQHKAADRVQKFIREAMLHGDVYVLQMDIHHYYESIDQDILLNEIKRTIRDKSVLLIWERIIRSYHKETGIGIPIGAVVSQLSANIYLNPFDHWIKEVVGWKYYVRYMDDMIFISNSKKELWNMLEKVRKRLKETFRLTLNRKTRITKAMQGIDFCGYRIFWDHMLPRKRNVKAARIRFKKLSRKYREGKVTIKDVDSRVQSFLGYMKHCDGRRTTLTTLKYLVLKKGE